MKKYFLLICSLFCLMAGMANAQTLTTHNISPGKQVHLNHTGFYENKGQITDQNYKPNSRVKYLLSSPGFNVQLRQTGFSYDTYTDSEINIPSHSGNPKMMLGKGAEHPNIIIRNWHRVDIELIGCNTHAELIPSGKSTEYYNYFTAGIAQGGVSHVHYYATVLYKDIYPHIDLEFTTSRNQNPVEYNFIVHPGGNPANIKLAYKGANKVNLIDNKLLVSVNAGDFSENIPSSYFKDTKQPVKVNYTALGNNTYGFSLANSNTSISSDLIIDPTPNLVWGTYYGGAEYGLIDWITLDDSNNVYITGDSYNAMDLATAGAYKVVGDSGGADVYVAKLNPTGSNLLWGTYYGGASGQQSNAIVLNDSNQVYITGITWSTSGVATLGAYQTTYSGGYGLGDVFVAKFNSTGSKLLWGTYYGGTNRDISYGIVLDDSDHVYITGYTESTSAIATPGAYQTTYGGGPGDVFVAKFNSTGSKLLWGTYYGGTGWDFANGITLDDSNNIYVIGTTESGAGIATAGAYQTSYGGSSDIFVAKFNPAGTKLFWGTYYGGSGGDAGYGIAIDDSNNSYITGYTGGIKVTAGAYQTTYGGGTDAFVAKFNSTGSKLVWGTYYGGAGYETANSIALDDSDHTYITGWTSSKSAMTSPGAYQTTYGGGLDDCFVAKFNSTGTALLWGTYYGGTGGDLGLAIAIDTSEGVYITGCTNSSSGIATGGAYQIGLIGAGTTFVAKFTSKALPLTPSVGALKKPLCNGGTGNDTVTVSGGTEPYTYSWAPSGGTTAIATGLSAGSYTVTVKDGLGNSATVKVTITQPTVLTAVATANNVLCNGGNGSATATAGGGTSPYIYLWNPSGGTNAKATGLSAGTYSVKVTDHNGCNTTAGVTITQPPVLTDTMRAPDNILCAGGTGKATVIASGGTLPYTYSWAPSGGTNATGTGLTAGSYKVTITDHNSCMLVDSVIITQPSALTATMGAAPNILCNGGTGNATVSVGGGASPYIYSWSPSGGTNATGTGLQAGSYMVKVTDHNGCTVTAGLVITQPPALTDTVEVSANIMCNGGAGSATVVASGGISPYTYSWAPSGGTNATATGLKAGSYVVTIQDGNGCAVTAAVTITQPLALSAKLGMSSNILCNGDTGNATIAVSGGTFPYTYFWNPYGGNNAMGTGLKARTYTVTIFDANGCSTSASVTITQPAAMIVIKDSVNVDGAGDCNGEASVNVSGGTAPYFYQWSPGGGTNDTINAKCAGQYCCTITDNNGCRKNVCINILNATGISEAKGENEMVKVYPNPNNGNFTIAFCHPELVSGSQTIEVYNILGERIYNVMLNQVQHDYEINLSSQPNGVYLYRVITETGEMIGEGKLIIQK